MIFKLTREKQSILPCGAMKLHLNKYLLNINCTVIFTNLQRDQTFVENLRIGDLISLRILKFLLFTQNLTYLVKEQTKRLEYRNLSPTKHMRGNIISTPYIITRKQALHTRMSHRTVYNMTVSTKKARRTVVN